MLNSLSICWFNISTLWLSIAISLNSTCNSTLVVLKPLRLKIYHPRLKIMEKPKTHYNSTEHNNIKGLYNLRDALMVHAGQLEQDSRIKFRSVTDCSPSRGRSFLFKRFEKGMNLVSISGFKVISLTSPFILFLVHQAAVTLSCADSSFESNSLFSFSTFCFSSYSSSSWTSICFSWTNTK